MRKEHMLHAEDVLTRITTERRGTIEGSRRPKAGVGHFEEFVTCISFQAFQSVSHASTKEIPKGLTERRIRYKQRNKRSILNEKNSGEQMAAHI